jgi:hypothetical protein
MECVCVFVVGGLHGWMALKHRNCSEFPCFCLCRIFDITCTAVGLRVTFIAARFDCHPSSGYSKQVFADMCGQGTCLPQSYDVKSVTACNLVEAYRRFECTYSLNHQARLRWWWKQQVSVIHRYNCTRLHGVICQTTVIFNYFFVWCDDPFEAGCTVFFLHYLINCKFFGKKSYWT